MLTFKNITVTELLTEAAHLFAEHAAEAGYAEGINPDVNKLLDIERNSGTITIVLYNNNIIVGYSLTLLFASLFDSSAKFAQNAGLFVSAEHRSGGAGLALIRETEAQANARGAVVILFSSPIKSALCDILPRRGYSDTEILYRKSLG